MHGYELRKRLKAVLGAFRAFSYGSLYPTLRRMRERGWITEGEPDPNATAPALTGRRGKVVYRITAEGKERLAELLAEAGPEAYDDEGFGVHFAFFAPDRRRGPAADPGGPPPPGRGAARRPARRAGPHRGSGSTATPSSCSEHGLESVDREVRWLNELIDQRAQPARRDPPTTTDTRQHHPSATRRRHPA